MSGDGGLAALEAEFRADLLRQWGELLGAADWWIAEISAGMTTAEIQEQVYMIRADNGEIL